MPLSLLNRVADRQAALSFVADTLKSRLNKARTACLTLTIVAAIAAATAAGLTATTYRPYLAGFATATLAVATFLTQRVLSRHSISLHVKARAASEALKRDAYLYATYAGPYRHPGTRDASLIDFLERINQFSEPLSRYEREPPTKGGSPRNWLDINDYTAQRLCKAIQYYSRRATEMATLSRPLHGAELVLAGAATAITAVAATTDRGIFDFAAATAALTTMGTALAAHLQAARYDEQIAGYRATANRLADQLARFRASSTAPAVADVAETVEEIIAAETKSWQSLWAE